MIKTQYRSYQNPSQGIPANVETPSWEHVHPDTKQIWIWIGILVLSLAVSLYKFGTYQLGTWTDDASYVTLARSLIETGRYGMINFPGDPGYAKYPFVFPMTLTPILGLFPGRFDLLPVASLLATLANISILFWGWPWFSNNRSYKWGLAVVGAYAINPLTIDHTRMVMSEPVFLTFCLLAILLVERYVKNEKVRGWGFWVALSAVLMCYSRSIGFAMLPVLFGYVLVRKGWQVWKDLGKVILYSLAILAVIVVITPVEPIDLLPLEYFNDQNAGFLQVLSPKSSSPAIQSPPDPSSPNPPELSEPDEPRPPSRFLSLLQFGVRRHLGTDIRTLVVPFGGGLRERAFFDQIGLPFASEVTGYLVSFLTIAGMLSFAIRNRFPLFMIFALVYLPLLFLWMWNTARLLYPIQPQLLTGFLVALEAPIAWIARKVKPRRLPSFVSRVNITGLLWLALLALYFYKSLLLPDSITHTGDIRLRNQWIQQNASPSDILMTESPQLDYLYTGLRTVEYPAPAGQANLVSQIKQDHASLILIAPKIEWEEFYQPDYSEIGEDVLESCEALAAQGKMVLIYQSERDGIRVYRVNPGGL